MSPQRAVLTATYRLQLSRDFPLDRARELVPYLQRLGVSHVYASPILAARPGSTHGYDVVDPRRVNPELGGEEALAALSETLRAYGLGLVLDIVPNHMATGAGNPFWDDVLMHGRASPYAAWFDIDWDAPGAALRGRVMLPVLGDELGAVTARDELRVVYDAGRFRIAYHEHSFPLDPATVHRVFGFTHRYDFPANDEEASASALRRVRDGLIPEAGATFDPERAERGVAGLVALVERSPAVRAYVDWLLPAFSAADAGRYRLQALLDLQHYSLASWRRGGRELNYRRFFDVDDLAAVRQEEPAAFDATHARVLAWVADGTLDALRVDHVDGLADPLGYLTRLRAEVERRRPGERLPIFVEKILSPGEHLRTTWPVDGTTGYEFLNDLDALFIDPFGAAVIERGYHRIVGNRASGGFGEAARRGKELVLRTSLAADVGRLARQLRPIIRSSGGERFTRSEFARAIEQLIVALPVYRTYVADATGDERRTTSDGSQPAGGQPPRVSDVDRALLERALACAIEQGRAPATLLRLLVDVLTGTAPPADAPSSPAVRRSVLQFITRFQQTSGPATAKGVEDTALYRYVPLASRNEVGGEPGDVPRDAVARLHAANQERHERWPRQLLAVSTHDTKRSADVRARLDVLSERPDAWLAEVGRWMRRHRALKTKVRGRLAPDVNTEYLLYQTLVGVWPLAGRAEAPPSAAMLAVLHARVEAYMLKAAREAKRYTSWTDPDAGFEHALGAFVHSIVQDAAGAPFRAGLDVLVRQIGPAGLWNALSRTLVHLTAPGTPDLYQGEELWDFSLVDPDNRRAVDYAARGRLLDDIAVHTAGGIDGAARAPLLRELLADPADGRIKLYVITAALAARREHTALFATGAYVPLEVVGPRAGHVFAFARVENGVAAITIVPRLLLGLTTGGAPPVGDELWADTLVQLPVALAASRYRDALTGREIAVPAVPAPSLALGRVLESCPVALLLAVGG